MKMLIAARPKNQRTNQVYLNFYVLGQKMPDYFWVVFDVSHPIKPGYSKIKTYPYRIPILHRYSRICILKKMRSKKVRQCYEYSIEMYMIQL